MSSRVAEPSVKRNRKSYDIHCITTNQTASFRPLRTASALPDWADTRVVDAWPLPLSLREIVHAVMSLTEYPPPLTGRVEHLQHRNFRPPGDRQAAARSFASCAPYRRYSSPLDFLSPSTAPVKSYNQVRVNCWRMRIATTTTETACENLYTTAMSHRQKL